MMMGANAVTALMHAVMMSVTSVSLQNSVWKEPEAVPGGRGERGGHVGLCTLSSWRAPSDMDCFTQLLSRSSFFTRMACHTSNTANITPQVRRGRIGIQNKKFEKEAPGQNKGEGRTAETAADYDESRQGWF